MEVPDAKRARLEHDPAAYPPPVHLIRPATTAPELPAHQHSHVEHPPSVLPPVHPYTAPPSSGAHPPPAHTPAPPVLSARPQSHEEAHQAYRTSSPGRSHDHSSGYGGVRRPQQAHPPPPPPPSSYSQPPPPAHQPAPDRGRTVSVGGQDAPMAEHHGHHPPPPAAYQDPNGHAHHGPPVNGTMQPHGLPYHQPHEQYPVAPPGHSHHAYVTAATPGYAPGGIYQGGPTAFVGQPRRKQVRAQQACNNCRNRKQKCDENKPCGYCKTENIPCEYREVPPPKTDRHIAELLNKQDLLMDKSDNMSEVLDSIRSSLERLTQQSSPIGNANHIKQQSPAPDSARAPTSSNGVQQALLISQMGRAEGHKNDDQVAKLEGVDIPDGVDEIPTSHETGAHYLLRWPALEQYFQAAGVTTTEYVWKDTEKIGILRPYGSSDIADGYIVDYPFEDYEEDEDLNTEAMWGESLPRRGVEPNIGGNNPDGSLDLDSETIMNLWDSYMRNMWALHPFLDFAWLKEQIEKFIDKHSPLQEPHHSGGGHFAMPGLPASSGRPDTPGSIIGKRKRASNASEDTVDFSPVEPPRRWTAPRTRPDRSMKTAIILLVLALGKLLKEDRHLLSSFRSKNPSHEPSEQSHANSPYGPSPASYGSHEAASSPGDFKTAPMSRGKSTDGSNFSKRKKRLPNVQIFPGLSYFSYALDILGSNLAGNGILHAQAFLLAGMYYGQLGRVTESWTWIAEGCRTTAMLCNKPKFKENIMKSRISQPEIEQALPHCDNQESIVIILCWSALQLESDLRAELDQLPRPMQLMYAEGLIHQPPRLVGVEGPVIHLHNQPPLDSQKILQCYAFQIYLRLLLNRVHVALYNKKNNEEKGEKRSTVMWGSANNRLLYAQLQGFAAIYNFCPYVEEYSATNLLEARLHAKYYGSEYIILRPFIYNALQWQSVRGDAIRPPFDINHWVARYHEQWRSDIAGRAGRHKHGLPPQSEELQLPTGEVSINSFENDKDTADLFLKCCMRCIQAAMASTVVFDAVANPLLDQRLKMTNIHGTATAQFSNILVLTAVADSWLSCMVDVDKLKTLMHRTIVLHDRLAPLAPIFRTNRKILQQAEDKLNSLSNPNRQRSLWHTSPGSGHGSNSMSPASTDTPRINYRQPLPPTSANSSFSSVHY